MNTASDVPVVESAALTTALKAFATLTREQKSALSRALDGFVDCLVSQKSPNVRAGEVIQEKSWHNRVNWDEKEWLTWETWGWYRHFCRLVGFVQIYRSRFILISICSTPHTCATMPKHLEQYPSLGLGPPVIPLWNFSVRFGTTLLVKKHSLGSLAFIMLVS